jgi:hypothetical protein
MGKQVCPRCNGSKVHRCPMCGNIPRNRLGCNHCGGKGTVRCTACNGTGVVYVGYKP